MLKRKEGKSSPLVARIIILHYVGVALHRLDLFHVGPCVAFRVYEKSRGFKSW